jgi:predicted ferric reductase
MLEFIGIVCIIYVVGLVLTLVISNTMEKSWNEPIGFFINSGFAVLWFILIPMLIVEKIRDRKNK